MTPEMTPERWRAITAVFHAALGRDSAGRAAFLDEACATDAGVRAEVERLLAAHHDAGRFGVHRAHALDATEAVEIRRRDGRRRSVAVFTAVAGPAPPANGRPPAALSRARLARLGRNDRDLCACGMADGKRRHDFARMGPGGAGW